MEQSILGDMRALLIGNASDTSFDTDLIIYINMVIDVLYQLGIGPKGFSISGNTSKWGDLLGSNTQLEAVKTYMYLKIKKVFDPPQSATTMEALNSSINELEWRLNVTVDPEQEDN